jgi:hypothetical protein
MGAVGDRAQGGGPAAIVQQGTFADGRALVAPRPGCEVQLLHLVIQVIH